LAISAIASISSDFARGRLTRTIRNRGFDVPTTVARIGGRLYAVNARFGTTPTPSTAYTVVQLRR